MPTEANRVGCPAARQERLVTNAFDISATAIDRLAALQPILATSYGIAGHDHEWGDWSPDGLAALEDHYRRTCRDLEPYLEAVDHWQRHAARVYRGYLNRQLTAFDHGDKLRDLNHAYSPFQRMRDVFDEMDRSTPDAWANICSRLETLGEALAEHRLSLEKARRRGLLQARRQVESVISQAGAAAGERSKFGDLVGQLAQQRFGGSLEARLEAAIDAARGACADFRNYLQSTYLPDAVEVDGVGDERYLRAAGLYLGTAIDPAEIYEWGWEEMARLQARLAEAAALIDPAATVGEMVELLETDPARACPTPEHFVDFVRERQARALSELDGVHFDVPDPARTVTVNLASPSVPPGAWYLPPTEDFSRPGGIWYALGDRQVIPLYSEVSTAYHEGFPGHHLQTSVVVNMSDRLSRAHRLQVFYSGYSEGWALYCERLMDELGFLEKPDYVLGMLISQLFRSCRVVVDIGCHLGLRLPEHAPFGGGEQWTYDRAVRMMRELGRLDENLAESEVKRYLGWPGQAISYKVGERAILGLRDETRRREGAGFSLKEFHRRMLGHGEVGLEMLSEVVLSS